MEGSQKLLRHDAFHRPLWYLEVRDKRVLMIIKETLEAGVMDEIETNDLGTQKVDFANQALI